MNTLISLIQEHAQQRPDHIWLDFQGQSQTYQQLWVDLQRCASHLLERGLTSGEAVLIVLPNGPDFFAAFYGVLRAGGIPVPIVPGSGPDRLAAIARHAGTRLRIVTQAANNAIAPNDWAEQGIEETFPEVAADDIALIQYTSGSTGNPKGVMLSHRNLLANIEQLAEAMQITANDVFVSWLPLSHDMGLIFKSMVPLRIAAKLVLLPVSLTKAASWLQAIQEHRGTVTAAPDFAYRYCLRYVKDPHQYDLSSLRLALNAAEPVRASTIKAFEDCFGIRRVMIAGYGLAEASVGVATEVPGHSAEMDTDGNVCVGMPFRDMRLRIDDGEILLRGPSVTGGYFKNRESTDALLTADGFVRTGDLGYLDAQGRLFVTGRKKDIIIHAGRNIAPREIEEVLDLFDFVRRSAAIGIDKGGEEGEQVYVFAEVARNLTDRSVHAARLVRQLHQHFGFRPGRLYLVAPKGIPRTPNGKLMHSQLKQQFLDDSLQQSGHILFPKL